MRLSKSVSKNSTSLYVIESTYIHGKRSTRTVESLGTLEELSKQHPDPMAWAQSYVKALNEKQKQEREKLKENAEVLIKLNAGKIISKNSKVSFNGGYLFLKKLFYQYGLNKICDSCQEESKAEYSLSDILERLVCARIIYPGSKLKTYRMCDQFIEPVSFELHDIYRALSVLSKKSDYIQSQLYKNSNKIKKRNGRILYYDCTNYYFEIEQEDDLRKYGYCKEHRPNPIVQMGLMMDEDGIPLAYNLNPGSTNEQITLTPLEKRIAKDFDHSKFIICTDAGLSGAPNRLFNDADGRAFITAQSLKKMSNDMQTWAINPEGWKILGDTSDKSYNLQDIEKAEEQAVENGGHSEYYEKILFHDKKDCLEIEIDDGKEKTYEHVNQTIYVTFSLKYRDYLRQIRAGQIERAARLAKDKKGTVQNPIPSKNNPNDYRRFINSVSLTESGELATHTTYFINQKIIDSEEKFDGFYGIATNLDDSLESILAINKKRWEIEECFRITKTTLKARPVYLSREDHINAHFLTCFLALCLYRFLEQKLSTEERSYTTDEIVEQLRNMNFYASSGQGYIPCYERTDLTDRLHQAFGFHTDYQILTLKTVRQLLQKIKAI